MAEFKTYSAYLDEVDGGVLIFANIPTGKLAKQARVKLEKMMEGKGIKITGPFAETHDHHESTLRHMAALSSNAVVLHLCLNDEHVGDRSIVQKHAMEITQSIDAHQYRKSKVVVFMQPKFTAKEHVEKRWSHLRHSLGFEDDLEESLFRVCNVLQMDGEEYSKYSEEKETQEFQFPFTVKDTLST